MKITISKELSEFDNSLEIYMFDEPFKHLVFTTDKLKSLCTLTNQIGMKTEVPSNLVNGNAQSNVGFPSNSFESIPVELFPNYLVRLFGLISKEFFPEQHLMGEKWNCDTCETTMASQTSVELESAILYPHTDNPPELIRENKLNRNVTEVGIIKLVLYTSDGVSNYADYGTKLYTQKPLPEDDKGGYTGFNLIKEIEYVNGHAMMWAPGADTWHGTDFCGSTDLRRIFYTGEYY
jgi:hypothetical protein